MWKLMLIQFMIYVFAISLFTYLLKEKKYPEDKYLAQIELHTYLVNGVVTLISSQVFFTSDFFCCRLVGFWVFPQS